LLRDAAMGEAYAHEKRLIRRRVVARRRELSRAEVARLSAAACERVLRLPEFAAALQVVAYAAMDNEVDPAMIAEASRGAGKAVYYPRVKASEFIRGAEDASTLTAAGLMADEPLSQVAGAVLVLVPGVAFDPRGVRLGRGRGWYDRVLARYPAATRLGLAYEFQVLPALPEAPWDVRMHALVTEARLIGEPFVAARAEKEGST